MHQSLLVRSRELDAGFGQELSPQELNLLPALSVVHLLERGEIELGDEVVMQPTLQLLVLVLLLSVLPERRGREFGNGSLRIGRGAPQAISQAHRLAILPKNPLRGAGVGSVASRLSSFPASATMSRAAGASGSSRQRGRPEFTEVKIRW